MQLVCVRHGRTAWNAERRFQGHTDVPLDPVGETQADALAVHLRGERFDLALCSDLRRAAATAERICRGRSLALEPEPRLREMRFGVWEGLTWDEIVARWPAVDSADEKSPRHYTAEGGESFEEVAERVTDVLAHIEARLPADGRALLVSHAGVMHALIRVMLGPQKEQELALRFAPASILRAEGSRSAGWELTAVNELAAPPPVEGLSR